MCYTVGLFFVLTQITEELLVFVFVFFLVTNMYGCLFDNTIIIIITKYLTQDIIYIKNENNKTTLTELTPPHVRACPKLGAAFSISYVSF